MTQLSRAIIDRCFGTSAAGLTMGGISVAELAERYGTPLFVYDRAAFDRQLDLLRAVLPAEFDVYYSIKANPHPAILAHFITRGCGLEIASSGEFTQAIAAGCAPERIVFAGPGKQDSELEATLSRGIGEIHVESSNEAARIAAICRRRNLRARVAVRVNPAAEVQGGAMRMGGKAAPFGVDEEKLLPLVEYLISDACFDFCGLHMFTGTQILDYSILVAQYRRGIEIARTVASKMDRPIRTIDLGGGLGIPYFDGDRSLDLQLLGEELKTLMEEVRSDGNFKGTRFVVEPGRFLAGEAGIYVVRVVDIKESRGKKFLVVDGGMNHHLAASGNLGQTIKRNYPIVAVQKLDRDLEETVDVVGPLCTPLDTLGRSVKMPGVEIGDCVAVLQSGAYARSASPLGFLSHPTPPEVWVEGGEHALIRTRGSADDSMRDVRLPPSLGAPRSESKESTLKVI